MTCSLVITTYNWKKALELVLKSALKQSTMPDEIIIADDGSNKDTKKLIERISKNSSVPIIHSWQEDDGFRAAMSRNRAIAKSKSEYMVLIDGDMILHHNFIEDHLKNAQEHHFIQGSRVLLAKEKSIRVLNTNKTDFSFLEQGVQNRKNTIHSNLLSSIFSSTSRNLEGIKTCNMSFFKKDCIAINGFNEDFEGWGREDSEFVVRLFNYGIKRKNVKFNCIAYHIWHSESSRTSLAKNDKLLEASIKDKLLKCQNGIDKYFKDKYEH